MLTPEDIKNLTEYQKTVFVTQKSFDKAIENVQKSFSTLQTSVDAIAKDNHDKSQAIPVINERLEKAENWIDKAAPKLGVKFVH